MRRRRQSGRKGNSAAGVKEKTPHATESSSSFVDRVSAYIGMLRCHVNEDDLLCVIIAIRSEVIDGREAQKQIPEGHGPPRRGHVQSGCCEDARSEVS